jgi:RNA polymerase sigma-70 factor (ECF subfamily)
MGETIIQSIVHGDRQAFKTLYAQFSDKVYNTALSYVQNIEDAEEVTQDVFTSIFRNASKFKGDSSLSTWIYRITINTSLNQLKKKKRQSIFRSEQQETDKPNFVHPGVLLERQENAAYLFKVIDTLADNQKTAFILSYVEDLPRQEVAEIMSLSLKAVESLLQRAKHNLRERLKNLYPNRRKN